MDNTSSLTKRFYLCLSERLKNENCLSDITWAMCQISDSFKYYFLHFFFDDIEVIKCRDIYIERERPFDYDSRPDFCFEYNNQTYIIENKIYDRIHHFHQYNYYCNGPRYLGYVTNYHIDEDDYINDNGTNIKWKDLYDQGFRTHTWEELYDYMNDCIRFLSSSLDEEETNMWEGYLHYIKQVCSIIKNTKVMKLDGLNSLFSFLNICEKICREGKGDNYSIKYTADSSSVSRYMRGNIGVNFVLVYKSNPEETIWGWIGVYFDKENEKPSIWIGFRTDWGKIYIEKIKDSKQHLPEGEFFKKPFIDSDAMWFELNEKKKKEFDDASNIEEQKKILKDFMDEVVNYPETSKSNYK